eukprot:gene8497-5965_t
MNAVPLHLQHGTFRVQSVNHQLNPSAPEFQMSRNPNRGQIFANPSALQSVPDSFRPTPHGPPSHSDARGSTSQNYDLLEEQIRKDFFSRCKERNEHMIAVFNLDPKTTKKELTAIFFPTGASDSVILDAKGGTRRRSGVVFFPLKDFAMRAVKTIDNFAPQRQSQLLVVRYCGPDSTASGVPSTLSEDDLEFLTRMLRDSILANPRTECFYVSAHSHNKDAIEAVLSYVRERGFGKVECASWPPPSSIAHQMCSIKLKNAVRSSVFSFPSQDAACAFVTDIELKAKAARVNVRCALLNEKARETSRNTCELTSRLGICDNCSVMENPFASQPADVSLPQVDFTANRPETFPVEEVYRAMTYQAHTSAFDPLPSTAQMAGRCETGDRRFAFEPSKCLPVSEVLHTATEQIFASDRRPFGRVLTYLITHPHAGEKEAIELSECISQAFQSTQLADGLKSYICDGIGDIQREDLCPIISEKRSLFMGQIGKVMLNLVVQDTPISDSSRVTAGEIAVYCFLYGYLPRTPPRFALCALNRLEVAIQGSRGNGTDLGIVASTLCALKHMVDFWGGLGNPIDVDTIEFSKKSNEIMEVCDASDNDPTQRRAIQLTPSARPTPRPIILKSSPSSGSSRRDTLRLQGVVGHPPQVKLSMTDTSNGISTDGSVESSLVSGVRAQGEPDVSKEDRSENTVFVSPLPSKLTRPQVRRLLFHFGEINKVRLKPKSKHSGSKGDCKGSNCNVFVEFASKAAAKEIIDFFSSSDKNFDFLRESSSEALFSETDIQLLQSTCARHARNEIRESHSSDAVYGNGNGSDGGEDSTKSRIMVSKCTFGLEEHEVKKDFGNTLSFSELPVDPIPTEPTREEKCSDDDMDEVLHACVHVVDDEPDAMQIQLDFDHTIHDPSHSYVKLDAEELSRCNPTFLFDNCSTPSSVCSDHPLKIEFISFCLFYESVQLLDRTSHLTWLPFRTICDTANKAAPGPLETVTQTVSVTLRDELFSLRLHLTSKLHIFLGDRYTLQFHMIRSRRFFQQVAQGMLEQRHKTVLDPTQFERNRPLNTIINVVPQGYEYVVERLGKYHRTLTAGVSFLVPLVDRIQYAYCMKEQGFEIPNQYATTTDNVMVDIDGILFLRIVDTHKASYNIENPIFNVINFAQTTMRSEIGRLSLDHLFKERATLNQNIIEVLRKEANEWGIECKRYEIRDIVVSEIVRRSMDLQAEAERRKRKLILDSEGEALAEINRAGGLKTAQQHAADAHKYTVKTRAEAEADAIRIRAAAVSENIHIVSQTLENEKCSDRAVSLRVAEEYLHQFGKIAKESNTVLMSQPINDPGAFSAHALSVFDTIKNARIKSPQLESREFIFPIAIYRGLLTCDLCLHRNQDHIQQQQPNYYKEMPYTGVIPLMLPGCLDVPNSNESNVKYLKSSSNASIISFEKSGSVSDCRSPFDYCACPFVALFVSSIRLVLWLDSSSDFLGIVVSSFAKLEWLTVVSVDTNFPNLTKAERDLTLDIYSVRLLNQRELDASQRRDAEEFAREFSLKPMTTHNRSSFQYKGSTKGAEVGARNEAAFMNYTEFKPRSISHRFAMPGLINLLTIAPLYCALMALGAAAWAIFYWDLYCRRHYETVLIARPEKLK